MGGAYTSPTTDYWKMPVFSGNHWSQREGSNLRPADCEPTGLAFQLTDKKGNYPGRKINCAQIVLTRGAADSPFLSKLHPEWTKIRGSGQIEGGGHGQETVVTRGEVSIPWAFESGLCNQGSNSCFPAPSHCGPPPSYSVRPGLIFYLFS